MDAPLRPILRLIRSANLHFIQFFEVEIEVELLEELIDLYTNGSVVNRRIFKTKI